MTYPEWLATCADLCRCSEPLTEAEQTEFRCLVAAEMARAEQRRIPQPQLELNA